jgi:hypothetical protein
MARGRGSESQKRPFERSSTGRLIVIFKNPVRQTLFERRNSCTLRREWSEAGIDVSVNGTESHGDLVI